MKVTAYGVATKLSAQNKNKDQKKKKHQIHIKQTKDRKYV